MYVTLGEGEPQIRARPSQGVPSHVRPVRRGAVRRARARGPGVRHAVGARGDARLRGRLAQHDGDDRRARRRADHLRLRRAAGARTRGPRRDDVPGPASVEPLGSADSRHRRRARRVRRADEPGRQRGRQGLSRADRSSPGRRATCAARAPLWDETRCSRSASIWPTSRARAPTCRSSPTSRRWCRTSSEASTTVVAGAPATLEYDPAAADRTIGAPRRAARRSRAPGARAASRDPSAARRRDDAARRRSTIDAALTEQWLVHFIRDEMERRGFKRAVVGVSGGVDSAVTAYLAARALGPKNVIGVRMPYRTSSQESLDHAQLVIDALGIESRTIDITPAVDGYLCNEPDADGGRRGNVMARMRMITLFDLAAKHRGDSARHGQQDGAAVRLFHLARRRLAADQSARRSVQDAGVGARAAPRRARGDRRQAADGGSRRRPDRRGRLRDQLREGGRDSELAARAAITPDELVARGFDANGSGDRAASASTSTHWKRRLPTVAMVSPTAIGESYLRPVDY